MKIIDVSEDEMAPRIARMKDLQPSKQAFVDTRMPAHFRDIYNVIGRGVTEDPDLAPAITDARYFSITYVGAEPGKGAALHAHETIEVFIPMTGKWTAYWGEQGEKEVTLDLFDVVSFPPGVLRGFKNAGDEPALLMAIIGSKPETEDGGSVAWAQKVLDDAEKTGLRVTEDGQLQEAG